MKLPRGCSGSSLWARGEPFGLSSVVAGRLGAVGHEALDGELVADRVAPVGVSHEQVHQLSPRWTVRPLRVLMISFIRGSLGCVAGGCRVLVWCVRLCRFSPRLRSGVAASSGRRLSSPRVDPRVGGLARSPRAVRAGLFQVDPPCAGGGGLQFASCAVDPLASGVPARFASKNAFYSSGTIPYGLSRVHRCFASCGGLRAA